MMARMLLGKIRLCLAAVLGLAPVAVGAELMLDGLRLLSELAVEC